MARHYHLIGICGTAMASLAGLLQAAGHRVTGSDENVYPPMSTLLDDLGIQVREGYEPANISDQPDVVVVGNAISRGNLELEAVLERKLYYTSAAATIKDEFLRGRQTIAVAGTHGKTSTASLVAWLLEAAGMTPAFLIGGVVENFGSSFRLTNAGPFVIEADEYDTAYFDKGPKFWHYLPDIAIVNNIEFDHADIFRDDHAYRFAFARFINLIPRNGTLVAGWDSPVVRELSTASFAPVVSFAFSGEDDEQNSRAQGGGVPDEGDGVSAEDEGAAAVGPTVPTWSATDVEYGGESTSFVVLHEGRRWARVETPLAGAFNVRNCLAAIAAATAAGADREQLVQGLATFRSVRRRLEARGTIDNVTIIDDFAHHPTAVRETILAARQRYPGRRLIAVFEPRSFTAQLAMFESAYIDALGEADAVVIAGLFHPERYTSETALDPERMVSQWRAGGLEAVSEPDASAIARMLTAVGDEASPRPEDARAAGASAPHARPGDVVLVMSNGAFGGIHELLLDGLRKRASGVQLPKP